MAKVIAEVILAAWLFIGEFAWVWVLFMALFVPVWMLLLLSRLGAIGKELRRMNGMPVPDGGGLFPNATVRAPDAPQPSLGHTFLK